MSYKYQHIFPISFKWFVCGNYKLKFHFSSSSKFESNLAQEVPTLFKKKKKKQADKSR